MAAIDAEWCGALKGRRSDSLPSASSPATEAIIETSSSSFGDNGGRIDGRRCASIDLPDPGGPIMIRLCPPAAATSSARFAVSWPFMSARSGRPGAAARTLASGLESTCVPRKWLAMAIRLRGARISMSVPAHRRLRAVGVRAYKPQPLLIGSNCGRQGS